MRSLLAAAAALAGVGPAGADALRSVAMEVGGQRAGFAFPYMAPGGCVLLTAAHVAGGNPKAAWLTPFEGAGYAPHVGDVHPWEETGQDASDVAVVDAPARPSSCNVFPKLSQVSAAVRVGAAGLLELAGQPPLPIRIEAVRPDAIEISSADSRRALELGHSGAPVWVGDVPVGILKRLIVKSDRAVVVRMEACASIAKARWIDPGRRSALGDEIATFPNSSSIEGAREFRVGLELALLRNSASARYHFDAAAKLGSVAATASLGEMLFQGEGGDRDVEQAAAVRDVSIDRLIDAVSRRSEPEAAFMLVALNAKGRLAGGDWARAAPIVRRLNERLKAREADGEVSAAAWRAAMGVTEGGILSEDYGRRIAKASDLPAPAAGPEPMLATCDAFPCLRDRSIEIAASALAGARGGDALAMLLVIPSFRRDLVPVDPAAALDCGPWRNDGRDPVATSAYLSCLTYASVQRIVGLEAQVDPDELGRATVAAIDAGAVGAIIAVTANPDQRSFSNAVKSALRNASEQEGSLDALFELGMEYGRWNGVERDYALAARYLEEFVRRTPTTRDGHGAALGFLAAMYDVGGFRLKADEAAFQRTVARMRELPAEQLNEGAQRLGMWQMGDPRGPASTTPRAVTVRSELLRLAAERGSLGAIGTIANVGDGGAEERATAAALSRAKGDMDVVEEDCRNASEEAADLAGRRVAERKCDLAARVGHVEASALIVRMYGDVSPAALRSARAWLAGPAYRRTKTADAALARVESGSSGVDMAGIEARLRSSAAFYDATAARSLIELMLDGRIAWSDEYARRLARLFVYDGGTMLWYRKETPFLATMIDGRVSVLAGVSGGRFASKSMRRAPKQRLDVVYDAYAQASGAIPG